MSDPMPPTSAGQTGLMPRVEIDAPTTDTQENERPHDLPEVAEPNSTTGRFRPVQAWLAEGVDSAKHADDSASGSADTALAQSKA